MEKISNSVASDVQASFRELSKTASQLNFVSDALGKYIAEIESGLKTLNLGVTSWVTINKWPTNDDLVMHHQELGYAKLSKEWCIALRTYNDADWSDEWVDYEVWAFNDGPRQLRINAIDKLSALLQKLNSDATKVSNSVAEKLPQASTAANQIRAIVGETKTLGKAR
jgi:hypothetical protein